KEPSNAGSNTPRSCRSRSAIERTGDATPGAAPRLTPRAQPHTHQIMIAAPHPGEVVSTGGTPLDLARLMGKRHPVIMGVLNVTPDSFSDGGGFLDPEAAIAHAKEMIGEGADIIDIGAESSRPYGDPVAVSTEEERHRLEGVLPAVARLGPPISIDTMKASVAA